MSGNGNWVLSHGDLATEWKKKFCGFTLAYILLQLTRLSSFITYLQHIQQTNMKLKELESILQDCEVFGKNVNSCEKQLPLSIKV